MLKTALPLAGLFLISLASNALAADAPAMTAKSGDTTYLVDAAKMTLYTFDADKDGVPTCYEACAANWPPLTTAEGTALPDGYTLVERKDGSYQVAYKGKPLYLWVKDTKPGDMTGDGVKGVWHTARP